MYAQTMDKIVLNGKPDGDFTQTSNGVNIYGKVLAGQKTGTWTETYANSELPHFIVQFDNNKKNGLYLEFDRQVKRLPKMRETQVQSLGWEDLLEKEMATHSSILVWKIPWAEEPGRLQSIHGVAKSWT